MRMREGPWESVVGAAVAVAMMTGACMTTLPPRERPARRAPTVELPREAPPPHHGWLLIEADVEPTTATMIEGYDAAIAVGPGGTAHASAVLTRRLCRTPCLVAVPRGSQEISLTTLDGRRGAQDVVDVGSEPVHVVANLGRVEGSPTKILGGRTLVVLGVTTLLLASLSDDHAGVWYGLGAGAVVGGGALMYSGRVRRQDGAVTSYPLTP